MAGLQFGSVQERTDAARTNSAGSNVTGSLYHVNARRLPIFVVSGTMRAAHNVHRPASC